MNLDEITISNFRSVRGSITVPLDAPVVLIHGMNGAGKTSVLAAIELALTGQFAGSVPSQPGVLVHRGSTEASIHLKTTQGATAGTVSAEGIDVAPILGDTEARFYTERCYLTQALLGRLLEIYQRTSGGRTDTPLTRFIKDLLRLDRLDALVDGLSAVGDVRNLRNLVPIYRQVETELAESRKRADDLRSALESLAAQQQSLIESVQSNAAILGVSLPPRDSAFRPTQWEAPFADDGTIEAELTLLAGARRGLLSAQLRLESQSSPEAAQLVSSSEATANTTKQLADAWRSGTGSALEATLDELREVFPALPSVASTGPREAYDTAMSRASAEVERCNASLSRDEADRSTLGSIDEGIAQSQARIATIDAQIEAVGSGGELQSLTEVLSELVVHVQGDQCPVCGRDFREVSAQPLRAALTSRIADLGQVASSLQALIGARAEASSDLRRAQDQQTLISARLLPDSERLTLQRRAAALSQQIARLRAIESQVGEGVDLLRSATVAATALARANEANRSASEVAVVVADFAGKFGMQLPQTNSVRQNLEVVQVYVDARISSLEARSELLTRTRTTVSQLATVVTSTQQNAAALEAESKRVESLNAALATAEQRRDIAKLVSNRAVAVRTSIARDVFDDSLNRLWRELFIRLAPGEPFVPAFRLPEGSGTGVIAELQTIHRDGEPAGEPQTMLSAGNLNTAALTLFFALHLSAEPRLPWLILDDPVQSMDEMHVAQFAALLRTIAGQHQRQVILAIHERPLFDYLALELSPGRPNDRLITIELSRERDGDTAVRPKYFTFEEDRAVPAA